MEPTIDEIKARLDARCSPWSLVLVCRGDGGPPPSPIFDAGEPVMTRGVADLVRAAMQLRHLVLDMVESFERLMADRGVNPIGWCWYIAADSAQLKEPIEIFPLQAESGQDARPEAAND